MSRILDKLFRQVPTLVALTSETITSKTNFIYPRFFFSPRFFEPPRISNRKNFPTVATSSSTESNKMSFDDSSSKSRVQLVDIFNSAVSAVQPASIIDACVSVVGDELRVLDKIHKIGDNVYLVGFGKAVTGMAAAMEEKLGSRLKRGIVSVPRGARADYSRFAGDGANKYFPNFDGPIEYREGATNNQPDRDSSMTSHDIADLAESLGADDTLVVLASGGGSALFFVPRPAVGFETKVRFCKNLQDRGAGIGELNVVRKKLSMVKGGGLALMAHPAKVVTLILSDIVGDPVDLVASGPTVYAPKSPDKVSSVLRKYKLDDEIEGDLKIVLTQREPKIDEKALLNGKKEFKHVANYVIGNNELAMRAASREARRKGLTPVILFGNVVGNVRDVSASYANLASLVCRAWGKEITRSDFHESTNDDEIFTLSEEKIGEIFESLENSGEGIVLVGGGEPEVTVSGSGRGGRNQELALRFSLDFLTEVNKYPELTKWEVLFLSAGTDGQDGPTDAAGAFGYPAIEPMVNALLGRLRKMSNERVMSERNSRNCGIREASDIASKLFVAEKIVPRNALANNDSYNFYSRFRRGKDLLKTGMTGTNVMDLHFLLVRKRECGCDLDFDGKERCADPLEEHDLHEDIEEREGRMGIGEKVDEGESTLLNLKVIDRSLYEHCCLKRFD